jgi:hypothetical protein
MTGEADPVSRGLARLHFDALAARLEPERVAARARESAARWARLAGALALASAAALALGPFELLEGLDVLVARGGRAPVPLPWASQLVCEVHPPAYLHEPDSFFFGYGPSAHPRGSVVTVRVTPSRPGRTLALRHAAAELPLVDDGHGGLMARWTLGDSAALELGARLGDVFVPQAELVRLESVPDQPPSVALDGAPRVLRVVDLTELDARYQATDDHGLTQVDLVLRAGEREERRVLARLDGRQALERGAAVVRASDRFVRDAFVPVQVTIEARDNDAVTGPKWGRSAAITLVPHAVGEPEARRFEAVRGVLDAALDVLAGRVGYELPASAPARSSHAADESKAEQGLEATARTAFDSSFGALRVPRALAAIVQGQLRRVRDLVASECQERASAAQCRSGHEATRDATEQLVLHLDAALRRMGAHDAVRLARRLADVADEAAAGARIARAGERERERGMTRLRAATAVLDGGAGSLRRLESLGRDLGEVVGIGLRRIGRCLDAGDLAHAELAAEDLAGRLRQPHPSFSGGGGRHGTESGMATGGGDGEGDGAEEGELEKTHRDLESLARDHASEMKRLEEELERAARSADLGALRDLARDHARLVREAVRDLPSILADPTSPEGAAARARESAEAMAASLEALELRDAAAAGRAALRAADQARRRAADPGDEPFEGPGLGKDLERPRAALERELRWTEQQLEQLRRAAAEAARDGIERASSAEERLARRTGDLGQRGRSAQAPMPKTMLELLGGAERAMHEASRALRGSDADKGVARQREAQRMLEMAREVQDDTPDGEDAPRPGSEHDSAKGQVAAGRVDIPRAQDFRGPRAFRERVLEGLGKPADPRLKDAVRRYAEGLLR